VNTVKIAFGEELNECPECEAWMDKVLA